MEPQNINEELFMPQKAKYLVGGREREDLIFKQLQNKLGLSKDFVYVDRGPDFVGSYEGGRLGVEITEIYESEIDRKCETDKEEIVYCAREKVLRSGIPPLHVCVRFAPCTIRIKGEVEKDQGGIKKVQRNSLAGKLFELVKNNYPVSGCSVELDYENGIPDEFDLIVINNMAGSKKHVWYVERVGVVVDNFSGKLQEIISLKAKKIVAYLKNCDKCWLVIVALGVSPSNFYEFSEDMEHVSYESPFEKVFFLYNNTFKELKVK